MGKRVGKWFAAAADFRKASLLGTMISASALFGLEFRVERDIPYHTPETLAREGEYARNRCKLDMRFPVGVTNFATVMYFHGGGIVKGAKGSFLWPAEALNHDPVALVSGGYRLLTNATPEQAISDAAAAVAWTIRNISRYGGDPKKVFVTGISGGGYLTAMVGNIITYKLQNFSLSRRQLFHRMKLFLFKFIFKKRKNCFNSSFFIRTYCFNNKFCIVSCSHSNYTHN